MFLMNVIDIQTTENNKITVLIDKCLIRSRSINQTRIEAFELMPMVAFYDVPRARIL